MSQSPKPISRSKHTNDLHRLLHIIVLTQSGPGWNATKLAKECEVVERTIYRDVKKLINVGVPIEYNTKGEGYRVSGEFFLPPVQLTSEEAIALAVLCEEIAGRDQIGFLSPALRGLQKLRAQLPADLRDEVLRKSKRVKIRTAQHAPPGDHADVFAHMQASIEAGKALECVYERPGQGFSDLAPFTFEPYALFFSVRAWYAVGRHHSRNEIRSLKLTRFMRVAHTTRAYSVPSEFSLERYLGNAWSMIRGDKDYAVEIRFDPNFAHSVIETMWHPTQNVDEHADGSATFKCTVSGLDEIAWWVLSMGNACKVVQPPELAKRIADEARKIAASYS